jgi:hypothetical protein
MPFRFLRNRRGLHPAAPVVPVVVIAAVATIGLMLGASTLAQERASKRDALAMKQKVEAIAAHGEQPTKQGRRTTVTENEVNAYLMYELGDDLPTGVGQPSVSALGDGRVSGRAVVDLDAVRKANNSTSLFDLRSYLTGQLPVTAIGVLRTSNGVGRFELQSATVGVLPVPKLLLQEIVAYYSKSPSKPGGISLDEQFVLPARIREIQVERGQAIIVQ